LKNAYQIEYGEDKIAKILSKNSKKDFNFVKEATGLKLPKTSVELLNKELKEFIVLSAKNSFLQSIKTNLTRKGNSEIIKDLEEILNLPKKEFISGSFSTNQLYNDFYSIGSVSIGTYKKHKMKELVKKMWEDIEDEFESAKLTYLT
jgi:hypothetical protein